MSKPKVITQDSIKLRIPKLNTFPYNDYFKQYSYVIYFGDNGISTHEEPIKRLNNYMKKKCAAEAYAYWMLKIPNDLNSRRRRNLVLLNSAPNEYKFADAWAKWGGLIGDKSS